MKQIWLRQPAAYWEEAFPVGNGRLGAMVYGGTEEETIQLNEESVWSGRKTDRCNPDCRSHLDEIRRLVFAGKIEEAQQLALYAMSGTPQSQWAYQTLGTIHISHHISAAGRTVTPQEEQAKHPQEEQGHYRRSLILDDAAAVTEWRRCHTEYRQTVFASYPDDVIVICLSAKGQKKLNFSCYMNREKSFDHACAVDERTISFDGDTGGMRYCGVLSIGVCDGTVRTIGENLVVSEALEAVLVFSAATSFRTEDPFAFASDRVRRACEMSRDELYTRHTEDYGSLYRRVELEFQAMQRKRSWQWMNGLRSLRSTEKMPG